MTDWQTGRLLEFKPTNAHNCITLIIMLQNPLPPTWISCYNNISDLIQLCTFAGLNYGTVERRLSESQSSETSNIRTHISFVVRSNNEKSAITSRNKVLCHFY